MRGINTVAKTRERKWWMFVERGSLSCLPLFIVERKCRELVVGRKVSVPDCESEKAREDGGGFAD